MADPESDDPNRRPWREGPEQAAPEDSWLRLGDDELLHAIQTLDPRADADERLLEIVGSDRHFFIRQEAAKRIRRKKLLFRYEDDKHIGQILVRHLTRREDLTYLERLVAQSRHAEVRKAAQVQLVRVRRRLLDRTHSGADASPQGQTPWRIAVVHPDRGLRDVVTYALPGPQYEVKGYDPGAAAVSAVKTFAPHLVLAGVREVVGESGLCDAIGGQDRAVPIVVLSTVEEAPQLPDIVGKRADEFMLLPVVPALLEAKARALLHLTSSAAERADRRKASGPIGEAGVLPLLRLCEEEGLTCRLVVLVEGARWFADFVDGEMTEAGGVPPVNSDDEAFSAILAVRTGHYEIIEALPTESEGDVAERDEVAKLQGVVASAPPDAKTPSTDEAAWSAQDDVDVTLLGWAIHFIGEQAWGHLGTAATAALLRRTLQQGQAQYPILGIFTVEENARVSVDLTRGVLLPDMAVAVTAQWMAAFLAAARRVAPEAASIDVREATKLVAAPLEHVDFYAAYDRAVEQRNIKPPSYPIGRITS